MERSEDCASLHLDPEGTELGGGGHGGGTSGCSLMDGIGLLEDGIFVVLIELPVVLIG